MSYQKQLEDEPLILLVMWLYCIAASVWMPIAIIMRLVMGK